MITDKTLEELMPDPRIPHFYIFPKIHKPAISGHQVEGSINCHTASISKH